MAFEKTDDWTRLGELNLQDALVKVIMQKISI
jgi:hypothetical protein